MAARFDGGTYQHAIDSARLSLQLGRVYALMRDGRRRTLAEIARAVDAPESSVSARLRDLRKERFGSHAVHRERVSGGLYVYWLGSGVSHGPALTASEPVRGG